MARDAIKHPENLEGQIVWFKRDKYLPQYGGGETLLGPYMNRPALKKSYYYSSELECYELKRVPTPEKKK